MKRPMVFLYDTSTADHSTAFAQRVTKVKNPGASSGALNMENDLGLTKQASRYPTEKKDMMKERKMGGGCKTHRFH
jgi:hypothetical protein